MSRQRANACRPSAGAALGAAEMRHYRHRLGLSQVELAELLGTSATTVARWERGEQRVGNPTLVHLALEHLAELQSRANVEQIGDDSRALR